MFGDGSPGGRRRRPPARSRAATDGNRTSPPGSARGSDALADGHRRTLVRYLSGKGSGAASLVELAAHLARREGGSDVDRVAVSLYHVHLPGPEGAGLVEFDRRSRTVRYRGDDSVDQWLGRVERVERAEREGPQ